MKRKRWKEGRKREEGRGKWKRMEKRKQETKVQLVEVKSDANLRGETMAAINKRGREAEWRGEKPGIVGTTGPEHFRPPRKQTNKQTLRLSTNTNTHKLCKQNGWGITQSVSWWPQGGIR